MNGDLCGSRTGMGSLSGGYTQGLCRWPRGHDKEGNKSAQHLVKEINYYAHGNECLFDKKKVIW